VGCARTSRAAPSAKSQQQSGRRRGVFFFMEWCG
jgi:hypothetical protein